MNQISKWPPLNCLKGFEAAARLGSFSKAAAELNMTQSAVSHQIKTLENYLDQALFLRANRKVILSDAGADLLETTIESLDVFANGLRRLEQYKKPNQIILHASSAFASNWLVPRLNAFKQENDEADVWLYTTDGEPDLELDEVDIAILYGDGNWPGMTTERLFRDALIPLCSPNHPIMSSPVSDPRELLNYKLLHGEQKEHWHTWFAHQHFPEVNPIEGWNYSNPSLMLQAAEQGEGIGLGSLVLAADSIRNGSLASPIPFGIRATSSYYLTYKDGSTDRPQLPLFMNWISQAASDFNKHEVASLESRFGIVDD